MSICYDVGARVERVNAPADSRIKNGTLGTVMQIHQCGNGELGYSVRFDCDPPDGGFFCAGTRLRGL